MTRLKLFPMQKKNREHMSGKVLKISHFTPLAKQLLQQQQRQQNNQTIETRARQKTTGNQEKS